MSFSYTRKIESEVNLSIFIKRQLIISDFRSRDAPTKEVFSIIELVSRKLETPKEITLETKSVLWAKCVQLEAFTQLIMVESGRKKKNWLRECLISDTYSGDSYLGSFEFMAEYEPPRMFIQNIKMSLTAWTFPAFTAVCVGNGSWLAAAGTPKGKRLLTTEISYSGRSQSRKWKAELRLWNRRFWKLLLSFNADSN